MWPSILRRRICPEATRAKSKLTAASSVGSDPCVLTRRRNSSFKRSTLFVVLSSERLPLGFGKAEEGEQLVAALREAPHNPGTALAPLAFEGGDGDPRAVATRGIDDAMKVLAEFGEHVLGRLALEVAQLMHTAALHRGLGPHALDGPPQPGVAVDDAQQRGRQAALHEIVHEPVPRRGRLGGTQLESQQLLAAIGEDPGCREHGRAHHLPRAAHPQDERVEVEIDHIDVVRETALFERGAALSSGANAPWIRRVLPPAR